MRHVRARETRNRCIGNQDRVPDSARISDAQFPAELERRSDRHLPIVRYDAKAGSRTLDLMRWGLVSYWSKDLKIGFSTINAMAETVDKKPVFREAFQRRRCIVPVDSFYEWKKLDPKTKQPYAIALADRSLMALAGLLGGWTVHTHQTRPFLPARYVSASLGKAREQPPC
jgi:putative SOS response-associated peptidase YedK